MNPILWKPTENIKQLCQMAKYLQFVNTQYHQSLQNYRELHEWSIQNIATFWQSIWNHNNIISGKQPDNILTLSSSMLEAKWFSGAKLNFAENLLQRRDEKIALIHVKESGETTKWSYKELYDKTTALAQHFKKLGLTRNDTVAGFIPNCPEAVIGMLAASSLGAQWCSCSPDFGYTGAFDRFNQVQPKVLLAATTHDYNGKTYDHLDKIQRLQQSLSIQHTILHHNENQPAPTTPDILLSDIPSTNDSLAFTQLPFDHPLYIMFSSGTTGKPKCIVHGQGGTLLQHGKEHRLHCDITSSSTVFFYTTTGWMMWNWLISALAIGATIVLYDGSPSYPTRSHLFDLVDKHQITHFGVAAKFIETLQKQQTQLKSTHNLSSLQMLMSTGSPLSPTCFDFVYENIKDNVCLSSIYGGTDILSCFALGNPMLPVRRGELQCLGLGMDVQIFDQYGAAQINQKGELVCTQASPCMPVKFLNDKNHTLYKQAYFEQYPNIWAHHDYALINDNGGVIIYGRSDTTLNPGGVRIGSAEIYRQTDKIDEIAEAMVVSKPYDNDEIIILFVKLSTSAELTEALVQKIKATIRQNLSSHHVPKEIFSAPDLPKTLSGKLSENTVKKILQGQELDNVTALANPECLDYFKKLHATLIIENQ